MEITHRNSLYEGTLTPPLSDIDYTVMIDNHRRGEAIQLFFKRLRLFFPMIGEVNILGPDYKEYLAYANPLLLKREIQFQNTREATLSERQYFLLRMYLADKKNLSLHPHLRKRKWERHLKETGYPNQSIEKLVATFTPSKELDEEEIRWEIFGLYTQLHHTYLDHLIDHLAELERTSGEKYRAPLKGLYMIRSELEWG